MTPNPECGNCDGVGCMDCRLRVVHAVCINDCPDCCPEPHVAPKRPPAADGIYPRCVWCDGENYGPAVFAYSLGETPCAAVNGCGKTIPEGYIGPNNNRAVRDAFHDKLSRLEGLLAQELIDLLCNGDRKFRVGDSEFRMAYCEELPDEWADDESIVMIEPSTGRLVDFEIEVFAREIHRPEPDKEPVDPNQLALDTTTARET